MTNTLSIHTAHILRSITISDFFGNIDATSIYFTPRPVVRSKYACMSYCVPIFSFHLECLLLLKASRSLKNWDPLLSGFLKDSAPSITIFLHHQPFSNGSFMLHTTMLITFTKVPSSSFIPLYGYTQSQFLSNELSDHLISISP